MPAPANRSKIHWPNIQLTGFSGKNSVSVPHASFRINMSSENTSTLQTSTTSNKVKPSQLSDASASALIFSQQGESRNACNPYVACSKYWTGDSPLRMGRPAGRVFRQYPNGNGGWSHGRHGLPYAGKERRELTTSGEPMIMIIRQDKKVIWTLKPEANAYMEMSLEESQDKTDFSAYQIDQTIAGKTSMESRPRKAKSS